MARGIKGVISAEKLCWTLLPASAGSHSAPVPADTCLLWCEHVIQVESYPSDPLCLASCSGGASALHAVAGGSSTFPSTAARSYYVFFHPDGQRCSFVCSVLLINFHVEKGEDCLQVTDGPCLCGTPSLSPSGGHLLAFSPQQLSSLSARVLLTRKPPGLPWACGRLVCGESTLPISLSWLANGLVDDTKTEKSVLYGFQELMKSHRGGKTEAQLQLELPGSF